MCAGHGMYTCSQVLLLEGRTVTVDWDSYNVADTSHDVARMLVYLKRAGLRHLGSVHALDGAAEVFLKSYVALGRSYGSARMAFQKAATCLERAERSVPKQARRSGLE